MIIFTIFEGAAPPRHQPIILIRTLLRFLHGLVFPHHRPTDCFLQTHKCYLQIPSACLQKR